MVTSHEKLSITTSYQERREVLSEDKITITEDKQKTTCILIEGMKRKALEKVQQQPIAEYLENRITVDFFL